MNKLFFLDLSAPYRCFAAFFLRSRLVQAAVDGGAAGGSSACAAVLATLKMRSNDVEDTHLCKNQARQLCKGGRAGLRLYTLCCPVWCARVRGSALCGAAQYRPLQSPSHTTPHAAWRATSHASSMSLHMPPPVAAPPCQPCSAQNIRLSKMHT